MDCVYNILELDPAPPLVRSNERIISFALISSESLELMSR